MARAVFRDIMGSVFRGVFSVDAGGAAFTPATLFASGEEGVWYDPSDITTMWSDVSATTQTVAVLEGSTPTTANLVAQIDDKSGNGNHATQGTESYASVTSGYARPSLNVLTGLGDISGDSAILRVDGSAVATSTADQGTGNYGNYPLNIGARDSGASLPFDGHLYGLIVRGASSDATEISNTETYLANRSGVTL